MFSKSDCSCCLLLKETEEWLIYLFFVPFNSQAKKKKKSAIYGFSSLTNENEDSYQNLVLFFN